MTVKTRQKIERQIAAQVVKDALTAGYEIRIDNGGDEMEPRTEQTQEAILADMFATDEEHLFFFKDGKKIGWVFFVYGNDGFDVISDYTTNLESMLTKAHEVAAEYGP